MNLDLIELKPLLASVQKLVEKGFGDDQVGQVDNAARSLQTDQTKEFKFAVVSSGEETPLRIQLKKDDVDAVSIWLFTSPPLAGKIQVAMKAFLH